MKPPLLKRIANAMLSQWGYQLTGVGGAPVGFVTFLGNCKRSGLAPETVVDVGVGQGTPWLYNAFPTQRLLLFDALAEFEDDMRSICGSRNAEYHITALGAAAGTAQIRIPDFKTGASLKDWTAEWLEKGSTEGGNALRRIPVDTLDRYLIAETGPFVLKLDVEGYEVEVLQGEVVPQSGARSLIMARAGLWG